MSKISIYIKNFMTGLIHNVKKIAQSGGNKTNSKDVRNNLKKNKIHINFKIIRNLLNRIKSASMAARITAFISSIIIIAMISASAAIYLVTFQKVSSMNDYSMKEISNEIYNNFQSLITIQTTDINKIALNSDAIDLIKKRNAMSRSDFINSYKDQILALNAKIKQYSANSDNVENIFVTDKEGIIDIDSDSDFLNNAINYTDYFAEAIKGKEYVSNVYTSAVTSRPVITFIQPLKDSSGNIIGTLGKTVFIDYFSKRFDDFKFLNTGFIFIVDNSQNIIYHPQKYYINKKIDIAPISELLKSSDIFSTKKTGNIDYIKDNNKYKAVYVTVPELKCVIFLTIPETSIRESSNLIGLIILGITILLVTIVIPVLYLAIKKIFKPMNGLIESTKEMANGNLTIRSEIDRNDEVGQLSNSFNIMADSIKELILRIKTVVEELVHTNFEVKGTQEENAAGMEVINENYGSIIKNIERINNGIKESSDSFKETSQLTENINSKSRDMLIKTQNIKKINESGIEVVTSLKSVNEEAVLKLGDVNNSFEELNSKFEDIKKILGVVDNISTQTHILSLNASIEAARAGDFGRGFNVVAEEIRKLSENTAQQMRRVEKIIDDINQRVGHMQLNIDTVNKVSNQQADIVNETIGRFNEIAEAMDFIASYIEDSSHQIEALTNENEKADKMLAEVEKLIEDFNRFIQQIKSVIEGQYERTKAMNSLLMGLDKNTEVLNANVNRFEM